jgi:hypothetical protein
MDRVRKEIEKALIADPYTPDDEIEDLVAGGPKEADVLFLGEINAKFIADVRAKVLADKAKTEAA